jgi:hypothetical protein
MAANKSAEDLGRMGKRSKREIVTVPHTRVPIFLTVVVSRHEFGNIDLGVLEGACSIYPRLSVKSGVI